MLCRNCLQQRVGEGKRKQRGRRKIGMLENIKNQRIYRQMKENVDQEKWRAYPVVTHLRHISLKRIMFLSEE